MRCLCTSRPKTTRWKVWSKRSARALRSIDASLGKNQLLQSGLKGRQHLCAVPCHNHYIAVTDPALAVDVNRRFDVEDHACFKYIRRFGMKAGSRSMTDGIEADPVAGLVRELFSQAALREHIARRTIDIRGRFARLDDRKSCCAGFEDGGVNFFLFAIWRAGDIGASDVRPKAVYCRVAMYHDQITRSQHALAAASVSRVGQR